MQPPIRPARQRRALRAGAALVAAVVVVLATLSVATTPASAGPGSREDDRPAGRAFRNDQRPLSPGCSFVNTTVPRSVLRHQAVPARGAAATAPSRLKVRGRLCLPANGTPKTVMLALHGITYTNQYWDVGYQPKRYSFARSMTRAGYAVYAIDRIGYGKSYHPNGALVTLDVQAAVAHQVIGNLRAGKVGRHAFRRVILVGHSYGTATSWLESAQYNDADAVIGTGWGSSIQNIPLAQFFSGFATHPAAFDAKTKSEVPPGDLNYFTPPANQRAKSFLYHLPNADPGLIRYDARHLRDTVTDGEGGTFVNRYSKLETIAGLGPGHGLTVPLPSVTRRIHIPMFLIDGQREEFFCGPSTKGLNHGVACTSSQALQREQAPYFSRRACERAAVTPAAGHDLNLQRNAPFTYRSIRRFADQVLGPQGGRYASYRSSCASFSGTKGLGGPRRFGVLPRR